MKVLKPVRFIDIVEKGSSTRPWIMMLYDNGKEQPYVVKHFYTKVEDDQFATAKEVVGNALASELGLYVADMALVEYDEEFISSGLEPSQREFLKKCPNTLKFASKHQDGMIVYSHAQREYLKDWDFANVYAFDCLCHNLDRGKRADKPNLLVENDNFLIIDHEQIFPFVDNLDGYYNQIMEGLSDGKMVYKFEKHIFFPVLKSLKQDVKKNIFDEFATMLNGLNIKRIQDVISQLSDFGISLGHSYRLIEYLRTLKTNSNNFCKVLTNSIL